MTKYAFIDDSHGILSSSSMIKRSSSDFGDEGLPMASSISYDFELLIMTKYVFIDDSHGTLSSSSMIKSIIYPKANDLALPLPTIINIVYYQETWHIDGSQAGANEL
ncbi:hypothetical protein CUMW_238900 [Citrus unshiu]|uniref:Uncharacterized protein n=1 Tax=Citrus unshiu TaxID=55188 RepID=A0A2H5QKM0_CITUN|nr:hypothetical protein CUMW_238900 [Citrus unshiu]